jgi:4-amino-4-deoxy-L-arabinose transferase-like glycosyltransferase
LTTTSTAPQPRISARSVDLAVLLGLIALAAAMRLPDLATRGTWDADQGHDMLVLRAFVRDGVFPLLGPPTSIGDFHHGAVYYLMLAPAAWLTGGDSPLAVVFEIALFGIAAVGVTWWLARSIGGAVAGLVAGLVMAISASAIEESTFIWNPNLIALTSAVALAASWRAWTTRRARWWLLAAVGTAATMQCHVLGVTLLPVVGALLVADARRREPGPARRAVLLVGLGGLAIVAASYIPLAIHELTNDFSELRAALEYIAGGGDPATMGPVGRLLVVTIRVVAWPLVGLITDAPIAAALSLVLVVAIVVWRWRSVDPPGERTAVRWLGLGLAWTALALTVAAPGLAVVIAGLPNDHYHAFADPMVFVLVGLGAGAAASLRATSTAAGSPDLRQVPTLIAAGVVVALIGWNVVHLPPAVTPDGGFPAAATAATRIEAAVTGRPLSLRSLPVFKTAEAYRYPLIRDGADVRDEPSAEALVIVCDSLFKAAIGAPCGGPAEDASLAARPFPGSAGTAPTLADRFEAAPGRTISVYLVP